jgi:hypothetical protein
MHPDKLTMLLEVLFAGSHELDSSKLVAIIPLAIALTLESTNLPTSLESRDDGTNQSTLQ